MKMKKYVFLWMIMVVGLLSCGDDDKPVIPELDKLTQVVCTWNGTDVMFFVYIKYTDKGTIASFDFVNGKNIPFIYVDRKITMINPEDDIERIEYILGGNVITEKSVMKNNPWDNKIYASDVYNYFYSGASLTTASRMMKWPKEDGNGYESQTFKADETYAWENGNITLFTQDKKRIEYTYSTALTPRNFPWRVIPSFKPIGFDILSPINQLYGNPCRNLPESAYYYNISGEDDTTAHYTYHFTTTGDYITGMTIREEISTPGAATEENTYEYTFLYSK